MSRDPAEGTSPPADHPADRFYELDEGFAGPAAGERLGISPAGLRALDAAEREAGAPLIFTVLSSGKGGVAVVRADGPGAAKLLARLTAGERVEIREVPVVDLEEPRPLTAAGKRAGWGR